MLKEGRNEMVAFRQTVIEGQQHLPLFTVAFQYVFYADGFKILQQEFHVLFELFLRGALVKVLKMGL